MADQASAGQHHVERAGTPFPLDHMPVYECGADDLIALVPFPADDANKFSRGKLTIAAGSDRYPGAACLAAAASQRMGAGYTEVVTTKHALAALRASHPSVVARPRATWKLEGLRTIATGRPQALVVGPGFDADDDEGMETVFAALKGCAHPVLVDGGGLDALATKKGRRLLKRRFVKDAPTVVTPHAGEAAHLGAPFGFSMDNPAKLACALSLAYGFVVVLKGPNTFVSDGERSFVVTEGTSALAKAGTGDVLAGMIGALLAQGLGPMQACMLGVTLHARAGSKAARRWTQIGVCAEDVVDGIPDAIRDLVLSQ